MELILLKKITVNGEEVEYFHIEEKLDGTTEITFSKQFNIIDAHMGDIMKRVRDNGLECQVFKDFKHDIIMIWLYHLDDLHGVLYSLNIPAGCYEVDDDMIVIDIPVLRRHLHQNKNVGMVML